MAKTKLKTICEVAAPEWWIDSQMVGHCRKYRPHYNAQQEMTYMLCSETKLPCPIKGLHQFPIFVPHIPEWMKGDAVYQSLDTDENGRRLKREKPVRSRSKYD